MRDKRYLNVIIGSLLLCTAVGLWALPSDSKSPPQSVFTNRVVLDRVQRADSRRGARFAGVTQAKNRAVLSFAVPARVAERMVESGSQVNKGAVLARLDDREFRNAVRLARATADELAARLAQARRDRLRIEKLSASNVATVSDLEKAETMEASLDASLQAAHARLKEARRLLGETVLQAPLSGTVTALNIQTGEWAVPGQPAIELTGDGAIELLVEVPESVVTHLAAGQHVQVQLPFADNRKITGRISTVAKSAISAGRLFPVKVELTNDPALTAGLTAQLLLDLSTENVLTVPLAAVVNPGASQPHIFIFRQGRVTKQPVVLGPVIQGRVVVQGDVADDDQVVISGQGQLADGDSVEAAS